MGKRVWFNIFFQVILFSTLSVSCKSSSKGHLGTALVTRNDLNGLWVLDDGKKMTSFLNVEGAVKPFYCLELKPEQGRTFIKFLFSNQLYAAEFVELPNQRYALRKEQRERFFTVRRDHSKEFNKDFFYFNFEDSTPYNPNNSGERDGSKEVYRSLDECVKAEEAQYKIDQETSYTEPEPTASGKSQ